MLRNSHCILVRVKVHYDYSHKNLYHEVFFCKKNIFLSEIPGKMKNKIEGISLCLPTRTRSGLQRTVLLLMVV